MLERSTSQNISASHQSPTKDGVEFDLASS